MPTTETKVESVTENGYSPRIVDMLRAQPLNTLTALPISVGPVSVIEPLDETTAG
jgi:hypothetical protein